MTVYPKDKVCFPSLYGSAIIMEFSVSIALYVINESSCTSTFLDDVPVEDENTNVDGDNDDDDINAKAFTINGPPKYSGNILDDPDAVWLNDQWNDERIDEANKAVQKQIIGVPEFWKQKYFVKAGSYWDTFYVRNRDNFYKDRHYLHVVFPELAPIEGSNYFVTLLEVGCGGQ